MNYFLISYCLRHREVLSILLHGFSSSQSLPNTYSSEYYYDVLWIMCMVVASIFVD
jgi:hypothetical protein